jgi:hypothetical protein
MWLIEEKCAWDGTVGGLWLTAVRSSSFDRGSWDGARMAGKRGGVERGGAGSGRGNCLARLGE